MFVNHEHYLVAAQVELAVPHGVDVLPRTLDNVGREFDHLLALHLTDLVFYCG